LHPTARPGWPTAKTDSLHELNLYLSGSADSGTGKSCRTHLLSQTSRCRTDKNHCNQAFLPLNKAILRGISFEIRYSVSLIGETKARGLTARMEHCNCSRMVSAVLPMNNPAIPVRATVPITTRSACNCFAISGMTVEAEPRRKWNWGKR